MGGIDADRASYLYLPLACQSSGFVYVAVQRHKRLALFDELTHRDTADVHIKRDMLVHFPVEGDAIQRLGKPGSRSPPKNTAAGRSSMMHANSFS